MATLAWHALPHSLDPTAAVVVMASWFRGRDFTFWDAVGSAARDADHA